MSTIPAPDAVELDPQSEALSLRERVQALLKWRGQPGKLPGGNDDLVELGLLGVGEIDGYPTWWITVYGMRLVDVQIEPLYQVTWRADGVRRCTEPTCNLETTRELVASLVANLRAGYRISRVTVLTPVGENVTDDVARGLIPHPDELSALAHRAAFLTGLVELADYLRVNPNVPVPENPHELTAYLGGADIVARRDALYVAAAALAVKPITRGHDLVATRAFGPVIYLVAAHGSAPESPPAGADSPPAPSFHPGTGPIGWTANPDGGSGE